MKHIFFFLLFTALSEFCVAQYNLDKEKLLELYQTQRYGEAASYLSTVYPAETSDIKALIQIAYCSMMAGNLVDAENTYQKVNELQPHQIPVLFSLANINSKRGNKRNAADYLQQIITLDSANFNAYKRLAAYTDSVALKMQYLQKANKLNTAEADVAFDLAFIHRTQKNYISAYQILKIAISADTSNMILQQALLPVSNQLKKYKEVISIGEKLLSSGADGNVVMDVGKAYFFLKNYKKALGLFQMLEQMSMQNESVFYYMSLCYREMKNYEMAAKYAKLTIEESISPNVSAYYNLLGSIYDDKQQLQLAANAYKKGLSYSANKNIYYRLGLMYDLKLKQPKLAMNYYRQFLKSKDIESDDQPQVDYVTLRVKALKQ